MGGEGEEGKEEEKEKHKMGVGIVDSDKMVGGSHNVWVDEETDRGLAIWSVQSQRVASTLGPMRQVRSTPPPVPGAPFRPSFPHISSSNPTPMPCVCYASSSCSSSPPLPRLPSQPSTRRTFPEIYTNWLGRQGSSNNLAHHSSLH